MEQSDYPLSEVPNAARKGLLSTSVVLLGFTFFTATMWAGGSLGKAFSFGELMGIILIGNLLLGAYAATLAYIAAKSGLNSVLMGRFCFGEVGSKLSDFILGFTQIGWYAWGAATIVEVLVKTTGLDPAWSTPLIIFFGLAFCITAMVGYRGLDWLSRIAVPLMMLFILISLYTGLTQIGGLGGLMGQSPSEQMSLASAITVIIGTFVSGGTQATNWSRFARTPKIAVLATLAAFFIGNGLMVLTGALGTLIYQQADIVDVMLAQGFVVLAVLMLFLNIWTTQDNTIYNFAVAGCNLLRTDKRRLVTLGGAAIGTLLALGGMYNLLIPFLVLLGTFIPPIGGVIMADFWLKHKGQYPRLAQAQLPAFNWCGLLAYALGSTAAYFSPLVPPVVGVAVAVTAYALFLRLPLTDASLALEDR
ncbi:cytosine permease [Pseudaeromonas paramecii]|uniref:Cytosine permease n=1 Tax=Pseudaeromonas paramecii TaxID=2138166 RepID=A0ABP8PVK2_9GAMM